MQPFSTVASEMASQQVAVAVSLVGGQYAMSWCLDGMCIVISANTIHVVNYCKTPCSCQKRQGASADKLQVRLLKSYPLLDSPDPSKAQSSLGTVLVIIYPPPPHQPGQY